MDPMMMPFAADKRCSTPFTDDLLTFPEQVAGVGKLTADLESLDLERLFVEVQDQRLVVVAGGSKGNEMNINTEEEGAAASADTLATETEDLETILSLEYCLSDSESSQQELDETQSDGDQEESDWSVYDDVEDDDEVEEEMDEHEEENIQKFTYKKYSNGQWVVERDYRTSRFDEDVPESLPATLDKIAPEPKLSFPGNAEVAADGGSLPTGLISLQENNYKALEEDSVYSDDLPPERHDKEKEDQSQVGVGEENGNNVPLFLTQVLFIEYHPDDDKWYRVRFWRDTKFREELPRYIFVSN